jgi:hypothetical protein
VEDDLRVISNQFFVDTVNSIILKYAKENSNGAIVILPEDARILRERLKTQYNQLSIEEKNEIEPHVNNILKIVDK